MTKQEILDRVDKMIVDQHEHIKWLESHRLGKIGKFFMPDENRTIDVLIYKNNVILEYLKKTKIEYENSDINLF